LRGAGFHLSSDGQWHPAAYTPPVRKIRVRMGHPKF
jgi:hypothetical protein